MRALLTFAAASALAMTSAAWSQGRLVGIDGINIYEIDMNDASLTHIGTVNSNPGIIGAMAYDWDNDIIYMASSQNQNLMTLDINTGNHTVIGHYGLSSNPIMQGLEFANGRLYGHSGGSSHGYYFYDINIHTGAASVISQSPFTSFHNLGYNSLTDTMYMTNSNTESLYTIDLQTGATNLVGPLVNSVNPNGMAFNHHNGLMYMIDNSTDSLYTLDVETGEAILVGELDTINMLALAYIRTVPGPGGLLAFALAGLVSTPRRRRA